MSAKRSLGYLLIKATLGPLVWFYCRPRVEGRDNIPGSGPVIIASNHLAEIDSLCLGLVFRRQLTFLTKSEYFNDSRPVARVIAWMLRTARQIPVDRRGGAAAARALELADRVLDAGGVWAVYPEGTRSRDGLLHRGRTGAMRVALARGCPVLPVTIAHTDRIRPLRPARVRVTIGPPLDLSPYGRTPEDHDAVRAATEALMDTLRRQGGLKYVNTYARPRQATPTRD